jgi:uncharacterized protein YjiS (DUF1127 family)
MTMSTTHEYAARQTGQLNAAFAVVTGLPITWMRRIRARRELMRLLGQPDYLLKDIGLQRDVIAREGLKRFWMS